MDQILYHYCGLDAFLSIIKNSTLWLSDIRKSNDYLECVYCRDKINEKIRGFLEDDKEALEAWDFGYNINSDLSMDMISYVACFSENKDQLTSESTREVKNNTYAGTALELDAQYTEDNDYIITDVFDRSSAARTAVGNLVDAVFNNTTAHTDDEIEALVEEELTKAYNSAIA